MSYPRSREPKCPSGHTRHIKDVLSDERCLLGTAARFGIALSGGGIRSASFALGVLQALVGHDLLKKFDYMSTVSGGGYIASALARWLGYNDSGKKDGEFAKFGTGKRDFPFGSPERAMRSAAQNDNLDFLRLHSNYLVPGSGIDLLSIIGIAIRNAFLSLLLHYSIVSLVLFVVLFLYVKSSLQLASLTKDAVVNWVTGQWSQITWTYPFYDFQVIEQTVEKVSKAAEWVYLWMSFCSDWLRRWMYSTTNNYSDLDVIFYSTCIYIIVIVVFIFMVGCVIYSLGTLYYQIREQYGKNAKAVWSDKRYSQRYDSQKGFGLLVKLFLFFALLGTVPVINIVFTNKLLVFAVSVSLASVMVFAPMQGNLLSQFGMVDRLRRTVGAYLFLGVLVASAYAFVNLLLEPIVDLRLTVGGVEPESALRPWVGVLALIVVVLMGLGVNVNYLGIHRMYRDRLMELFLPDVDAVNCGRWKKAECANSLLIEQLCKNKKANPRPYLLINTNVVLADSSKSRYRERGGDNFVISPLYCGSEATGWRKSKCYMKTNDPGMTLATAMAISGAAASPNAGAGAKSWTKNRAVSIMMSILNLRLGYWAPHPGKEEKWFHIPNFVFPGISSAFLFRRLHEKNRLLDLTDGGHFENLGLYELIRRELDLIFVCDASADPDHKFEGLALAAERVRVDFGAAIEFCDLKFGLDHLAPDSEGRSIRSRKEAYAKRGYAVARITYKDGKVGTLIYLKPTLTASLGVDVMSYWSANPSFPHESTTDQFFDEVQFEAYRELGVALGHNAAVHLEGGCWSTDRWIPPDPRK